MSQRHLNRLGSASSSGNKSYDEEQIQNQYQRGNKRHISQVTKQKIEEFKSLTEQFLQGQRVPELSELQKELIKQQHIDSIKDSSQSISDLRKVIVSQKNEKQRNQIQAYQNKYKKQQEKLMMEKLEKKTEVDERTRQQSNEYQKKIELKLQNNEERLKQEQLEKQAKNKLPGIKDIFFKQFIKQTEDKSPSPSCTSDIAEERYEDDDEGGINIQDFSNNIKKDTLEAQQQNKKTSLVISKFNNEAQKLDLSQGKFRGKSLSQQELKLKKMQDLPIDFLVSSQFQKNNAMLKSQYYNLNRFNQFQKDIENKLRLEQERLINEQKIRNEIEAQTNNFVLTKEMWEKVIEADKNNQPFHLPNFGIEKTPVYKMQQNDEEEKRNKINKKQRIKQGVFVIPKRKCETDLSVFNSIQNSSAHSEQLIKSARLVWGQNFLKTSSYPYQGGNHSLQTYNYSIQEEEPDLVTDEKSSTSQHDSKYQKTFTDKDSLMNKSQSAYLPQHTVGSSQDNYADFNQSRKAFADSKDLFNSAASTKEQQFFQTTSNINNTISPKKRHVYTNSHLKIKLY